MPLLPWGVIVYGALIFGSLATVIALFQAFTQPTTPDDPPTWVSLLISAFTLAIMGGVVFMVLKMKLITEVRSDGVYVRFMPFHFKPRFYPWADITKYEALTYRPLWEYGGWGIKGSWKGKGIAYSISGNRGVRLDLTNGKHVMIGSLRADEFAQAIRQVSR